MALNELSQHDRMLLAIIFGTTSFGAFIGTALALAAGLIHGCR